MAVNCVPIRRLEFSGAHRRTCHGWCGIERFGLRIDLQIVIENFDAPSRRHRWNFIESWLERDTPEWKWIPLTSAERLLDGNHENIRLQQRHSIQANENLPFFLSAKFSLTESNLKQFQPKYGCVNAKPFMPKLIEFSGEGDGMTDKFVCRQEFAQGLSLFASTKWHLEISNIWGILTPATLWKLSAEFVELLKLLPLGLANVVAEDKQRTNSTNILWKLNCFRDDIPASNIIVSLILISLFFLFVWIEFTAVTSQTAHISIGLTLAVAHSFTSPTHTDTNTVAELVLFDKQLKKRFSFGFPRQHRICSVSIVMTGEWHKAKNEITQRKSLVVVETSNNWIRIVCDNWWIID